MRAVYRLPMTAGSRRAARGSGVPPRAVALLL